MTARAAADGVLAKMVIEGDRVSIRPASAGDLLPLQRMHDRCSLDSRVHRWLGHVSAIPHDYLAEAVRHDPRHLALVAHADGPCPETVALASAVHVSGTKWEIGILIEDRYQRKGLGSRLLDLLVRSALPGQCRYLIADALADHQHLLNRLAKYGELTMTHDYDGVAHAVVKIMHDTQLRSDRAG